MGVQIKGHSDDTIIVSGDVNDEFDCFRADNNGDDMYVALSDGSLFSIAWTRGVWRIHPVAASFNNDYQIAQAPEDDEDNYSDILTTDPDGEKIRWVVYSDRGVTLR